jgi:predicted transcriptional regulator
VKGFFERSRERARRLDRNDPLTPEIVIGFEDAAEMVRVLSTERVRLLGAARKRPASVSELANSLERDPRAVSRDVDLLEAFGLLHSTYKSNPGHGRRRVVEPSASHYKLVANI